ncbi:cytochrome P450 CYP94D108 [Lotus japonicus]|uniref:cytochrome P450 CYP94D108 n=1 Tax=Lotus japonicus TaxID=34305 RepID=UPI002587AAFE|nr:cytochrome P450 CYP94D108 [Lotus japonicus]
MELFSTQSLLFFFFFFFFSLLLFIYFYLQSLRLTTNNKTGFKIYPLIGCMPEFLMNRHRFLDWSTEVLRDCPTNTAVFARPGNVHGVITANPAIVEHMLKTNFENYPKGQKFIFLLGDFLGTGIFNSDGDLWMMQRKTASYEFSTKSLRNFVMENATAEMRGRLFPILARAAETNRVLDLQDILERFAFDNVCKLAFNVDPGCLGGDGTAGAEFMAAFENATMLSQGRFMAALPILWKLNRLFKLGPERRLRESISTVHEFADKIIRSRLEEAVDPTGNNQDLLSRFIGTENCSPEFLRYIVISFILAGRDTTSSALSWFFWLISSRPDVREKIRNEIKTVRIGKTETASFSYEELKEMHYLHAAISETMRLFPPVPVDTKSCSNDDVLPDGTRMGKGWFISYHTYAMGRMVSVWGEDCEEFRPERWLDGGGLWRSESPFKFPVFHAGPRMCLGKEMAYIQMKYIAASVMEMFEVEALEKDTCPEHVLSLTLRMKCGLPVRVRVLV